MGEADSRADPYRAEEKTLDGAKGEGESTGRESRIRPGNPETEGASSSTNSARDGGRVCALR